MTRPDPGACARRCMHALLLSSEGCLVVAIDSGHRLAVALPQRHAAFHVREEGGGAGGQWRATRTWPVFFHLRSG